VGVRLSGHEVIARRLGSIARSCCAILSLWCAPACHEHLHLHLATPTPPPPVSELRAGAATLDLTPPPGAPLWGYALTSAAPYAQGYRTRLKVHAIVLQSPAGGRLAIVQVDLGAVSRLLHVSVAERLASQGFGPDRLLIAASHTHAGPGGYFGDSFYNTFGAGRSGFDPVLLGWLAERIAGAVELATERLEPAALGAASVRVSDVSYNRSLPAWRKNRGRSTEEGAARATLPEFDDRLRLLRVDRLRTDADGRQSRTPMAAFATFAIHSTAVGRKNTLYHGDVLGHAWRQLALRVRAADPGAEAFVAAFAAGSEGDVAPLKTEQSFAVSERIGRRLGDQAFDAFQRAGSDMRHAVEFSHGYQEVAIAGALTARGAVCDRAMVGVPAIAGTEDGPSAINGKLGAYEGRRWSVPRGCHGAKVAALAPVQRLLFKPPHATRELGSFPAHAAFQVLALYEITGQGPVSPFFSLVSVPAEPTTAVGDAILRRVATSLLMPGDTTGSHEIAVVGLANGYLGYLTTPPEYDAQHYEGGSSLFGPLVSVLAEERLGQVATDARAEIERRRTGQSGPRETASYARDIVMQPGARTAFFGSARACSAHAGTWTPPRARTGSDRVTFDWAGLDDQHLCDPPELAIECDGRPLLDRRGIPETDDGTRFDVRRSGSRTWHAVWFPLPEYQGRSACRLRLARAGLPPLWSEAFSVGPRSPGSPRTL
jgi:neutral ceramidase